MVEKMLPLRLHECSWTQVRDRLGAARLAILPAGATEAHGPHLPLMTDVIIADEWALRGAQELRRRGTEALVLPTLDYAVTYVGSPFAGTIGITPATLQALITDIGRSLERQGITHLLLPSAHLEPAHLETLYRTADTLEWETRLKVAVLDKREPKWAARLSEEFRKGARHAGAYETSLVWLQRPDLTDVETARQLAPVWVDLPAAIKAGARTFDQAGSPLAYFGEPAQASLAEGERLYRALGAILADAAEELLRR